MPPLRNKQQQKAVGKSEELMLTVVLEVIDCVKFAELKQTQSHVLLFLGSVHLALVPVPGFLSSLADLASRS